MVRDFHLAEELYQEVSVRILEREEHFQPGPNFGAWARAFARRTVLEEQRRRGRLLLDDGAAAAVAAQMDDEEDSAGQREALRECLDEVPGRSRRLVRMRYEQDLSMAEIAERMNRTAGAVQVALSRVRAWLGDCIRARLGAGAEA
jgi:RNA polymerase sigma-70 factor (ECF subfamily)